MSRKIYTNGKVEKIKSTSQELYHATNQQKQRRKVIKQVRAYLMGKDEKKSEQYSPDKLKVTESIRKKLKPKKARKCGNFGLL